MSQTSEFKRARGRPRDPQIEPRILDAAMTLYAAAGWSGFTFDVLARTTGVGKAALYSRWNNRMELLRATLETRWFVVSTIDTGSLRADLLELCHMVFSQLTGPYAAITIHLHADALRFEDIGAITSSYGEVLVRQGRTLITRAIDRGELPHETDPALLLDPLIGGVTNHVLSTPMRLRDTMLMRAPAFISKLVDLLLSGIAADART